MRNTAEVRVGRLLEVCVGAGYRSTADVDQLFHEIACAMSLKPHRRFVIVADWRRCPVMSSEAAEKAVLGMARNNSRVERSAVLASSRSPTAVLQFMRLVRQTNNDSRLLFEDAEVMVNWLRPALTAQETARLRTFLAEGDVVHSASDRPLRDHGAIHRPDARRDPRGG